MPNREKLRFTSIGFMALAVSTAGYFSAQASTPSPSFGPTSHVITNRTPNHAIFLRCKVSATQEYQSKAVVLNIPNSLTRDTIDYALVTAHGLENTDTCFVKDFNGNSRKVIKSIIAKKYKVATDTDWALVSFKRIKGAHIERYDIDNYVQDITALDNYPVSFAEARGLPQNTQKCKVAVLALRNIKQESRLFASHDCRAIAGQSGSPITLNENGQHKLIGLHLGNIWTLYSPITGKPSRLNFMRPFDKKMSAEIKTMLVQIQE